ncbi:MAG: hypothetical protein NTV89_07725 [Proteobacteria bacterium]|nr:hypothetical protein [Pseudomonadota bacterium]
MYDVRQMRSEIEDAVLIARQKIRDQFKSAFKTIYRNKVVPQAFPTISPSIFIEPLVSPKDLDAIPTCAGFYIILSTFRIPNNECRLTCSGLRAIYRGECYTVRRRIMSHLFNQRYKDEYKKRKQAYISKSQNAGRDFYEQYWPACLKIHPGINGINIDSEPYCTYTWRVIVHEMTGSSREVRQQAELAFDDVFGKPTASREGS